MTYPNLHVVNDPLANHYLTLLRDSATAPTEFRAWCRRLTTIIAVEAAKAHLKGAERSVLTPIEATTGSTVDGPQIVVAILRAGLGMLDPVVELFPDVSVGYIGLERDEDTAEAASYYAKLPPQTGAESVVFLLDPMLATGGSAAQACGLLKKSGAAKIVMLTIVAAPEGVKAMLDTHPDVFIYTAALDRELNEKKYIVPGLGDFGDRLYGT